MRQGNNLKAILEEKGISVNELAKSIGATRQYINEACNGNVALSENWASRIAAYLGIDVKDILPNEIEEDGYVKKLVVSGGELKFCNKMGLANFVNQLILLGYRVRNVNYLYELEALLVKEDLTIGFLPVRLTIMTNVIYIDFYRNSKEAKNPHNVCYTIYLDKVEKEEC